jgi:phosphoserine phosphatase
MDEAVAYADNWSDRALLARVGRAVAVRPHRKLKRLARHRGWTIARPSRPSRRDRQNGSVREESDE